MLTTNPFNPRPPIRIRLRPDSPSGISLADGKVLNPGDEADVEYHLACSLVANGRASIVPPEAPADDEPPVVVEHRDPKPSRRR